MLTSAWSAPLVLLMMIREKDLMRERLEERKGSFRGVILTSSFISPSLGVGFVGSAAWRVEGNGI